MSWLDQHRKDVALFACYCVGSAHGDSSRLVKEERAKVMNDNAAYAYWHRVRQTYDAARNGGQLGIMLPGDPFVPSQSNIVDPLGLQPSLNPKKAQRPNPPRTPAGEKRRSQLEGEPWTMKQAKDGGHFWVRVVHNRAAERELDEIGSDLTMFTAEWVWSKDGEDGTPFNPERLADALAAGEMEPVPDMPGYYRRKQPD